MPELASSGPSRGQSNSAPQAPNGRAEEPLPVWFFVGLILLVYGAIVLFAGIQGDPRPTVLRELRPALWWGGVMLVGGAVFLFIGLRGRTRQRKQCP